MDIVIKNEWNGLRQFTDARIALGRAGSGLPTEEYLLFRLAHAQAKDAVRQALDRDILLRELDSIGLSAVTADSLAGSKQEYLTRPDLGRSLHPDSAARLAATPVPADAEVLIVLADGLSARAVHEHAITFLRHFLPQIKRKLFPCVVAAGARVALGDEIGQLLRAPLVIMLIGERPGLSSPDSLGIYMTWHPHVGRQDSERNCISNVRPAGIGYAGAARKLAWLVEEAFRSSCTGIALKDLSDLPRLNPHQPPPTSLT